MGQVRRTVSSQLHSAARVQRRAPRMTFGRILWCVASAFILYTPLPSLASDISHVGSVTSVGCAHEHLNVLDGTEVRYAVGTAQAHSARKRQSTTGLIIQPFYDATIDQLQEQHREMLKDVVDYARDYFMKTLVPRSRLNPIRFSRGCNGKSYCTSECPPTRCVGLVIPDSHLGACNICDENGQNCTVSSPSGPGVVDADFVLYVTADESRCSGSFLGFGSTCFRELQLDRPVAGAITFCVQNLQRFPLETWRSLTKHEMLHALGFLSHNFAFFRDSNGNPRTPRDPITNLPSLGIDQSRNMYNPGPNTILTETVERESITGRHMFNVTYMVTPTVQMEARKHFNCSALRGLELENAENSATKLQHWEQRFLHEEGMTGVIDVNSAFSRLTLAFLQDTGWYDVDFSMADPLRFGLNLGCNFAQKSCYSFGLSNDPYCSEMVSSIKPGNLPFFSGYNAKCTYDRTTLARCNVMRYNDPLPPRYQYFSNGRLGSFYEPSDYCPVMDGFRWCLSPLNQPSSATNAFAETFSSQSGCIKWEIPDDWTYQENPIPSSNGSGCYQHYCTDSHVVITVQGKNHTCLMPGQRITVNQTQSSPDFSNVMYLKCPPYEDMCWSYSISSKPPTTMRPTSKGTSCVRVAMVTIIVTVILGTVAQYY